MRNHVWSQVQGSFKRSLPQVSHGQGFPLAGPSIPGHCPTTVLLRTFLVSLHATRLGTSLSVALRRRGAQATEHLDTNVALPVDPDDLDQGGIKALVAEVAEHAQVFVVVAVEAVVKASTRQRAGAWGVMALLMATLLHLALGAILGGVCQQSLKGEL